MRLKSVSISALTAYVWWLDPDGADRNVLAWWVSTRPLESRYAAGCGAFASTTACKRTKTHSHSLGTSFSFNHVTGTNNAASFGGCSYIICLFGQGCRHTCTSVNFCSRAVWTSAQSSGELLPEFGVKELDWPALISTPIHLGWTGTLTVS